MEQPVNPVVSYLEIEPPVAGQDTDHLWKKSGDVLKAILPFGKKHWRLFTFGMLSAVGVVIARLAVPWPLRAITESLSGTIDAGIEDTIWKMGLLFVLCMALLGLCDFLVRLYFTRFSIGTTRDLRQATFSHVLGIDPGSRQAVAGDLVSRLIGDTARLKSGLQGFFVHVARNGLVFIGVTIILFMMNTMMGLVMLVAGIVTALITLGGARLIFANSLKHREKEGQLANKINTSVQGLKGSRSLKRINKSSGRFEASQTKIQGQVTWLAHTIFGIAVLAALWFNAQAVIAQEATIGDVFVFIIYALMLRGPIVRLARQGTRTGLILGPGYRLVQMLQEPAGIADNAMRFKRLEKSIKLKKIVVDTEGVEAGLGPLDLTLNAGEHIALYSDDRSEVRSLLGIIAGEAKPREGKFVWDGARLGTNWRAAANQVTKIEFGALDGEQTALEQRLAEVATMFHRRASVWLFDNPGLGLNEADTVKLLSVLLQREVTDRRPPTVIVGCSKNVGADNFDRVVHLRNGRIVYDGPPGAWRPQANVIDSDRPLAMNYVQKNPTESVTKILFCGYAPVHFRCFKPLYDRLKNRPDIDITLSGGLRKSKDQGYEYDTEAMYANLDVTSEHVMDVNQISEMDFDVQFTAHTRQIQPRSVQRVVQVFHGISFRNRAVRPENMGCDNYFLVGPYMRSRFLDAGLMRADDPRAVPVGFMKTDPLVNGSLDADQIRRKLGIDNRRPVLLYAPTGALQNSLETMGEEVIRRLIACDSYNLLVKPHDHPKNTGVDWATYLRRYEGEHCRIIPPHEDVVPMMYIADLLMSDASSVANEYCLLDRPILFLDTPDLIHHAEKVDHSMLDLTTWGRKSGQIVEKPGDIARAVDQALADPTQHAEVRQAMVSQLFYNPGQATDAAIRWLEDNTFNHGVTPLFKNTHG